MTQGEIDQLIIQTRGCSWPQGKWLNKQERCAISGWCGHAGTPSAEVAQGK
jgi:hypothetical protein